MEVKAAKNDRKQGLCVSALMWAEFAFLFFFIYGLGMLLYII